jgi:hypothetical protein
VPSPQIAQLAADLAPYLLPLLPLLAKGGRMAGGAAAKALGSELGERAPAVLQRLWDRLARRLRKRPEAVEELRRAARSPDGEAAVQERVAALLAEDEPFRAEVASLLDQVVAAGIVVSHLEVGVHGGDLRVLEVEDAEALRRSGVRTAVASGRIGETRPGSTAVGLRIGRLGKTPEPGEPDGDA